LRAEQSEKLFNPREKYSERKQQEDGENYTVRTFIMYTLHQIILGLSRRMR
jgi:hypothetical protein